MNIDIYDYGQHQDNLLSTSINLVPRLSLLRFPWSSRLNIYSILHHNKHGLHVFVCLILTDGLLANFHVKSQQPYWFSKRPCWSVYQTSPAGVEFFSAHVNSAHVNSFFCSTNLHGCYSLMSENALQNN